MGARNLFHPAVLSTSGWNAASQKYLPVTAGRYFLMGGTIHPFEMMPDMPGAPGARERCEMRREITISHRSHHSDVYH